MTDPIPGASTITREAARKLADDFASAWTRGRVDLMEGLFAPSAVFIETPFSTPLAGTDAIRQWASDIPYHQSEANFTVGEVYLAGPWFACEFKLVFRRRTTGEFVDARGAFFVETAADKITEMRMYWHRWSGGHETSLP